jgi:hypothetical protein
VGDEKQARHVLAEMAARIARSPYDALDIQAGSAEPAEVRSRFLELTKTYHPAKFARMSLDIQKMANEVFLSLRAAHDQLARAKPPARVSGPMPVFGSKTAMPETVRPNTPPNALKVNTPATPVRTQPIPTTPSQRPSQPPASAGSSGNLPAQRSNQPPASTAALNPGTQPRATVPATRPGTQPQAKPGGQTRLTPAQGVPVVPRPGTNNAAPATSAAKPAAPSTPAPVPKEPELVSVYELLHRGEWDQARTTLNALIALQPKPRYQALVQYSHGREAQLSRRLDEARVDLQGALEIDPELQLAKTALAELFTRRR